MIGRGIMQYKDMVKPVSISPKMKTKQKEYLNKGALPIIDQGQKLIGGYSNNLNMQVSCTLPVIVFGDHTKVVKYIDFPFGAGADGIKVLQPRDGILPKYLFYGTKYLTYRIVNKGYARHYQHIEKMSFSVPSIPEQDRIVSRIEELFSDLDKAVETLQTTKKQLAVYRQAVLQEEFAKVNKKISVESVCAHVTDGDHISPPKALHGVSFVIISNIENNKINWDSTNYVKTEYYNQIGEKRTPKRGDVLYTVTGSFGIPVIVDFDKKFCFQRHIALLRPNEKILQKYLYYVMQSPDVYSQAKKRATGTAQKTVGLNVLRKIQIPYTANQKQQQEIVAQIESRLSACDIIEKTVDVALSQAEAMRQSILKQTFEREIL